MNNTKIEWCDHTVNFWWGCTKVSPACAHCYAEKFAGFVGKRLFGQPVKWGDGQPRAERLAAARKEALRIQAEAATFAQEHGRRPRVFVNSMSDWLDDQVPVEWLAYLLKTLHLCPAVDFLLLTKRPENWRKRLEAVLQWIEQKPWLSDELGYGYPWQETRDSAADWFVLAKPPANLWIGTTVEDQERANERIPHLLEIPAAVRFLSCEPLLGPVDLLRIKRADFGAPAEIALNSLLGGVWGRNGHRECWVKIESGPVVHWVIAGGESGTSARPIHPDWFRSLRDQCKAAGVPFLFKQWGEWNCAMTCARLGKAAAGRLLDGREWNELPTGKEGA